MLLEEFLRNVEGFPRSVEEFPRSEEGFPLEVTARPSDVSLGERSRRLLILGSTKDDGDGTTLPCVSIMGCPLKELGTSALSASPRRLTEGVLEVKGVHFSRLLILGSTKDDGDGTTLPCVSIMGCSGPL